MAKYTNRVDYLGMAGIIQSVSEGAHNFLYRVSTVKDPKWNVGDRVVLADGRECVYAKSDGSAALYCAHGCEFSHTGLTSYTAFGKSYAAGVTTIEAPAATHDALDADELAGGTIIIFDGASDYYTTTRMIVGNAASGADAAITLYLDAAIDYAITAATSACEVYRNPYSALTLAGNEAKAKAGKPMAYVSAAENYFWVQKSGICWIAPHGTDSDNGGVGRVWREDGSLEALETAYSVTVATDDTAQYAGYCAAGSPGGNGPLFMLQC
jgi:hypothetical protein